MKCFKALRTWTNSLSRSKQLKKDMRFGIWNVRSLCRLDTIKSVVGELQKCKLDLVGVQEIKYEGGISNRRYLYIFMEKGMLITTYKQGFSYTIESFQQLKG